MTFNIRNFSHFSETLLPDDAKPLLIVDEARLQGNNFCAFAYQRTDALGNVWPAQMGIDLSKPWLFFVSEYKFISLILLIPNWFSQSFTCFKGLLPKLLERFVVKSNWFKLSCVRSKHPKNYIQTISNQYFDWWINFSGYVLRQKLAAI